MCSLFVLKEIDLPFATFNQAFFRAPLLKPVAMVNPFNGHKKFEIIGIAQGENMLKNSKHFYIIHEKKGPKWLS
jgi:hypothetical protein